MIKNTGYGHGGLLVNKEAGVTSFDVIRTLRNLSREARETKWGHSGTLDPFATGVLLILIGHATRLQEELHLLPKTYRAEITLGATSDTDDSTGTIQTMTWIPGQARNDTPPSESEILATLEHIQSQTSQIPPQYAAIKVQGKKMYEYAREGKVMKATPRPIKIHNITLESYTYPSITITVTCSTGTYIRSIARDIGELLETGAYCNALTRTAIGPFTIEQSKKIGEIGDTIEPYTIPMEKLTAHLPRIMCSDDIVAKYKQGRLVRRSPEGEGGGGSFSTIPINTPIALLDETKKLFGIGTQESLESGIQPKKIFL